MRVQKFGKNQDASMALISDKKLLRAVKEQTDHETAAVRQAARVLLPLRRSRPFCDLREVTSMRLPAPQP
ncbi:hypothetical protein [Streptomyces sp. R35]|uniref:Uncharacterized protein n=1 Tax=Streptomyces sp. R35 TaxID=3238630 RepID=A0AB39SPY9_9ACTN